ncbi:MAG: hypothetical protein KatS3mg026_0948 [Bacteroidia bacterium]|nr:MAG: hypothetical protein KatS3mg026_0948 [Bacteroidia bacterium]
MTYLWVWLQLFPLTAEWGETSPVWTFYGAEIRKTSAYQAPRAFCLLLNGANRSGLPYQTDNPRLSGYADSAQSPCIAPPQLPVWVSFAYQRGGLMDPPETGRHACPLGPDPQRRMAPPLANHRLHEP